MMNAQEKLTYERQLGIGRGSSGGANGGAMTDAEIAAAKIQIGLMKFSVPVLHSLMN